MRPTCKATKNKSDLRSKRFRSPATWHICGASLASRSRRQGQASQWSERGIRSLYFGASVASGCWLEMQTFCRQSYGQAHDTQSIVPADYLRKPLS